jgi:beta-xylosidase
LFFDNDGKVYLTWAKYIPELDPMPPKHYNLSCFTMPVDLATGRSLSPAKMVRHNSTIGNWVSEGPHIIKRGEWYYLITADGGTHTAHQEWVCRSKQGPFGPWEEGPPEINPVIYNGDDEVVTMTGHSELKWLGLARTGSDWLGRGLGLVGTVSTCRLIPVQWTWSRGPTGGGGPSASPSDRRMAISLNSVERPS